MDFLIGDKEKALISEIRDFARKELPADWVGPQLIDSKECSDFEFELQISKKLSQKGWLTMAWPKEYGGCDASYYEQTVYDIETNYWNIPGTRMGVGTIQWIGPSLLLFGSESQKRKYLPLIAAGEADGIWCTGYSEPNAGSDLASIKTQAIKQGTEYIINGQKVWTSAAHRARWCWLLARTDIEAGKIKKHRGLSIIIVDMKSPGITIRPLINYYGRHHFNEVFFDNVRVPVENLVGVENERWSQIMKALAFERRSTAPAVYGYFKRLLEDIIEYVKNTKRVGKLLSDDSHIRNKIIDMAVDLEILKMFAYQLTWRLSRGDIPTYEASRNKIMADDIMKRMSFTASEIIGAYSQIDPDSKWGPLQGKVQASYLGFPGYALAGGTGEIEKSVIAQFKLGLPRSY